MKRIVISTLCTAAFLTFATTTSAATISLGFCPTPTNGQRCATLTEAISGSTGEGNINSVDAILGGTWTNVGELTGNGTNGFLTVNLTSGSWGGGDATGTWAISSGFNFADLAITMHVGNGGGSPDHFVWLVVQGGGGGPYSGTWTYDKGNINGGGGGLSNIFAFGRGTPTQTPEGGDTLALLGVAMLAIGVVRYRLS